MSTGGRPRVLDDAKRRDVCTLAAAGCGLQDAARYIGCSVSTIRRELAHNRQFKKDLRASELSAQLEPLRAIRKAAATHWRAAAWMLERTNPRRFARPNVKSYGAEEVTTVIEDLINAATDEIPDVMTRIHVRLRLRIAAGDTARALGAAEQRLHPNPAKYRAWVAEQEAKINQLILISQQVRILMEKAQNAQGTEAAISAETSAMLESACEQFAQEAQVLRLEMGPPSLGAQNPGPRLPPPAFPVR